MNQSLNFRSNGKLLISAEYLVLLGAEALAIPTSKGQTLSVSQHSSNTNEWQTFVEGKLVFKDDFDHLGNFQLSDKSNFSLTLERIFKSVISVKGNEFLKRGHAFKSNLEFPMDWGLGSSSSLVTNISSWADVDAFELQKKIFKGSGYDVACALAKQPIIYKLVDEEPHWKEINYLPAFKDELYFIHLNRKQDSREAISLLEQNKGKVDEKLLQRINDLTGAISTSTSISEFSDLITEHEAVIGRLLNMPPIKERLFSDFNGAIKSLGAWGGDFIMATGHEKEMDYFRNKGYNTVISFEEMIYHK